MWSQRKLVWALGLSLLVHLVLLPFFGPKAQARPVPEPRPGHLEIDILRLATPRPTPPPTPEPTPPPARSPRTIAAVHAPHRPAIRPLATQHVAHGLARAAIAQADPGTPDGNGMSGSPGPLETGFAMAAAPDSTVSPQPTPTPSPKPACANPNADAGLVGEAVEPDYPSDARERGASGTAQIEIELDASGAVTDARIARSSGNAELDRAALAAARASRYAPAVVDCVKTAGRYLFRADFDAQ